MIRGRETIEFDPPELAAAYEDDGEFDQPAYQRLGLRRLEPELGMEIRSGARDVRLRPLCWTMTPPTRPGWYYVRRPGRTECSTYRVARGDSFGRGIEWCGPLPEPRA